MPCNLVGPRYAVCVDYYDDIAYEKCVVLLVHSNTKTNIKEILAQYGSCCLFDNRISFASPLNFLVKPQFFFLFLKWKIFIQ